MARSPRAVDGALARLANGAWLRLLAKHKRMDKRLRLHALPEHEGEEDAQEGEGRVVDVHGSALDRELARGLEIRSTIIWLMKTRQRMVVEDREMEVAAVVYPDNDGNVMSGVT